MTIAPAQLMLRALERAAGTQDALDAIHWLQVADLWERRVPVPTPDAPTGFAKIMPQDGETHRITLCIGPDRVTAILDPRFKSPRGATFRTPAEAVQFVLSELDKEERT